MNWNAEVLCHIERFGCGEPRALTSLPCPAHCSNREVTHLGEPKVLISNYLHNYLLTSVQFNVRRAGQCLDTRSIFFCLSWTTIYMDFWHFPLVFIEVYNNFSENLEFRSSQVTSLSHLKWLHLRKERGCHCHRFHAINFKLIDHDKNMITCKIYI